MSEVFKRINPRDKRPMSENQMLYKVICKRFNEIGNLKVAEIRSQIPNISFDQSEAFTEAIIRSVKVMREEVLEGTVGEGVLQCYLLENEDMSNIHRLVQSTGLDEKMTKAWEEHGAHYVKTGEKLPIEDFLTK